MSDAVTWWKCKSCDGVIPERFSVCCMCGAPRSVEVVSEDEWDLRESLEAAITLACERAGFHFGIGEGCPVAARAALAWFREEVVFSWSDEAPKIAGFYFMRYLVEPLPFGDIPMDREWTRPTVVEVFFNGGKMRLFNGTVWPNTTDPCQFAGPIPIPKDSKASGGKP